MAFTTNSGQCCCAGTRVLVQASIYDALVTKVAELAAELKVGDPFSTTTNLGQ